MFWIGMATGTLIGFACVFGLVVLISRKRDEGLKENAERLDKLDDINRERNRMLRRIAITLEQNELFEAAGKQIAALDKEADDA